MRLTIGKLLFKTHQNENKKGKNMEKTIMKKSAIAGMLALTGVAIPFASRATVPVVTAANMEQAASSRLVTITYTLTDAPAVVTLDIQTNATANAASDDPGWTSIGGDAVWNASGDVWKKVGTEGSTFNGTITWRPDLSWPDHKIDDNCARAVVTAWALDNTPAYMVVSLDIPKDRDGAITYYPGVDYLPKSSYEQAGAAVTNNPAYKTTKLLMRKIMAAGVRWTMGSTTDETRVRNATREAPNVVSLSNNYYIGVFELTQRQWALVATNSAAKAKFSQSGNQDDMRPMEMVSYNELRNTHSTSATAASVSAGHLTLDPSSDSFCGLLRIRTGLDFDLPAEAQWEFACRAGHGSGYWNDGSKILNSATDDGNLAKLGRYSGNNPGGATNKDGTLAPAEGGTQVVGSSTPNDWGLYDMHGNVFEWCLDWQQDSISTLKDKAGNPYNGRANINPDNPAQTLSGATTGNRIRRGGSAFHESGYARPANRENLGPATRTEPVGLRLVCTAGLE